MATSAFCGTRRTISTNQLAGPALFIAKWRGVSEMAGRKRRHTHVIYRSIVAGRAKSKNAWRAALALANYRERNRHFKCRSRGGFRRLLLLNK